MVLSAKNKIVVAINKVFLAISSVQLQRIQLVFTKLQNNAILAVDNSLEITFLVKISRVFSLIFIITITRSAIDKTLSFMEFELMLPYYLQESVIFKNSLNKASAFRKAEKSWKVQPVLPLSKCF